MLELKYEPYDLLHQKVNDFDFSTQDPVEIENAMIEVMKKNLGIGLAANQVGLDARVFVLGSDTIENFPKPQAFFNPKIIRMSEEYSVDKEGCLSFPGLWLNVKRPTWIDVVYQDVKGNTIEAHAEGYIAKAFQHEYDHLEGICFTNRVSKLVLDMAVKKSIKKYRKKK